MANWRSERAPLAVDLDWTDAAHPMWRWILRVCAVAALVPLWSAPHLPFTDLPEHVAAIATLRHWFDPGWNVRQYFTLALGQSNYLLYYLAGALLAFPLGNAERANVALLSVIAVGFPYALRSLLRALEADERLALFGCTLFWCQSLLIGFFNYLAALPIALWGLSLAVREAQAARAGPRRWALAAAAVALFYMHLSAFVFFVPAAALCFWLLPMPPSAPHLDRPAQALLRRLAGLPLRLAWLAPSAALVAVWLWTSPVVHPGHVGWVQDTRPHFQDVAVSLQHLPEALIDVWRGTRDEWCLLALLAAGVLLAWPRAGDAERPDRAWRRGLAALWVAIAALLYLAMPRSAGWLDYLNERYAILAALLAAALFRPARGLRGAAPMLLLAATALFAAGNATAEVRAFEREVGPFDQVLAAAAPGRRLMALIFDQGSNHARFAPFLHFGGYYRARGGAVASISFAELPQSPLRYRPESAPPRTPPHAEWEPDAFRNDVQGPYYDYVLVRGAIDPFARNPRGPRWRLAARQGRWALYAKVP
jgi:hypothetical protein